MASRVEPTKQNSTANNRTGERGDFHRKSSALLFQLWGSWTGAFLNKIILLIHLCVGFENVLQTSTFFSSKVHCLWAFLNIDSGVCLWIQLNGIFREIKMIYKQSIELEAMTSSYLFLCWVTMSRLHETFYSEFSQSFNSRCDWCFKNLHQVLPSGEKL